MPPHFDLALHHRLQDIASSTLAALGRASIEAGGKKYDLRQALAELRSSTELEPADSPRLASWNDLQTGHPAPARTTTLLFSQTSTLRALRRHATATTAGPSGSIRVGVLNFANAEHPGGGFEHGAQAQEESLVRSSTLYASLTSDIGRPFYASHSTEPPGLYTDAMIWSPGVLFFRADDGDWIEPVAANVVTSPAVNVYEVKGRLGSSLPVDTRIADTMRERMARILRLFELKETTHVVLGSFGTGAFGNDIATVARLWADLLGPGSRFERSFSVVEFAIIDQRTLGVFKQHFEERCSSVKPA
ncbi:hypothetical protein EXIGLDRAFT_732121 [Exidia glandulosa HHB12029]|uniref:Microbial-type PARG catalytic domain-containing protein n=1 Tax=Exidia glandulosa HHB12029 TaxID=1314781 RepID=A0A165ZAK7_EXIGL|nr:hypothetical protein EXIGLDRAFT_732121 [Exidia glandulosa HHB12029]